MCDRPTDQPTDRQSDLMSRMHATKNIEVKFHFVLEINCMSYL